MGKREIREIYRQIRLTMSLYDVEESSLLICRQTIRKIDWAKIKNICSYNPIADLKEVNVTPLLKTLGYKYPGIKIKALKQSRKQAIPKTKFDIILVPVLAFDDRNHRLGWGGGFYDRFLAQQPQALKVGLCFQNGFVKAGLPIEPHDVKLDMIITEEQVYQP